MLRSDGTQDILRYERPKCPRCRGFIVADMFVTEILLLAGARCINCGWVKLYEERKEIRRY